ncbi:DinI family protein, partial [Salmonella bongori]|nr:DinI family protein [Salmonella bongori]
QNQYENCNLTIRRGSQDGLSIIGAAEGLAYGNEPFYYRVR